MDRQTSNRNMSAGLLAGGVAAAIFALCFIVALLYVAHQMAEHRHIPEPGETIQLPKPSWGPAFFAAGAMGLVGGIYAAGFIFSPAVYSIVGLILFLFAFRSLVRGGVRSYFRQPRRQTAPSAALPVETIVMPKRRRS